MIQIKTVSMRSDVSDYWDEYREVEYEDAYMGRERIAFVAQSESIDTVIENCDSDSLIVDTNPTTIYTHPDADAVVKVYDGYNE